MENLSGLTWRLQSSLTVSLPGPFLLGRPSALASNLQDMLLSEAVILVCHTVSFFHFQSNSNLLAVKWRCAAGAKEESKEMAGWCVIAERHQAESRPEFRSAMTFCALRQPTSPPEALLTSIILRELDQIIFVFLPTFKFLSLSSSCYRRLTGLKIGIFFVRPCQLLAGHFPLPCGWAPSLYISALIHKRLGLLPIKQWFSSKGNSASYPYIPQTWAHLTRSEDTFGCHI